MPNMRIEFSEVGIILNYIVNTIVVLGFDQFSVTLKKKFSPSL